MKGNIAYQEDPVAERYRAVAITLESPLRGLARAPKGELLAYAKADRIPREQARLTSAELRALLVAHFGPDLLAALESQPEEVLDVVLDALPVPSGKGARA